jgi:hypothetical protein
LWNAYRYKQYATFDQIFDDFGPTFTTNFFIMNVAEYPLNNTEFRLAVVHAINYTEMLDEVASFQGKVYGEDYLGPLTQQWGKYYDPDNLPMYSYNLSLALHYMNLAGEQEHFSLTLPNGTIIGNTTAPSLGPLQLVYEAPITPVEETENEIIQSGLSQIGLAIAPQGATPGEEYTYTTPATTPPFVNNGGWGPSWPDPILGELIPVLTPVDLETWMNLTQVNQLLNSLTYETNQNIYMQGIAQLYNITYNYAPDIWLPVLENYLLVQPYLKGMVYCPFITPYGQYWANTLYYANS